MIDVRKLSKSFGGFKALADVHINVQKGSVYGLLGPNGAGKTTLIKHLAGVYRQDTGTITIDGRPVYENPFVKSQLVYIPDDLYFFTQYSIADMAAFYAGFYPTWDWKRFHTLQKVFSIDPQKRVIRLSRGMQKQVAFWLGICVLPRIMILDEPVDGLDPVMRKKVWSLVLQDVAARQTTVLVSSHNLRELEDVCDHVGILHDGKILVEKDLDDLKTDIHKLQVGFNKEVPPNFLRAEAILHREQSGSIIQLIVRGNRDQLLSEVRRADPVLLDILPLTLEEIFIYELGGIGYDIQNILI